MDTEKKETIEVTKRKVDNTIKKAESQDPEYLLGITQLLETTDLRMLLVKTAGGYKFRERLTLSDKDLQSMVEQTYQDLRRQGLLLALAEKMLREPPKSYHNRWDEYSSRAKDVLALADKTVSRIPLL